MNVAKYMNLSENNRRIVHKIVLGHLAIHLEREIWFLPHAIRQVSSTRNKYLNVENNTI